MPCSLDILTATFAPERGVFLSELYNADTPGLDDTQVSGLVGLCAAYAREVRPLLGALADRHADVQALLWGGAHLTADDMTDLGIATDARGETVAHIELAYVRTLREGFDLLTPEQVTQATAIRRDHAATDACPRSAGLWAALTRRRKRDISDRSRSLRAA